MSEQMEGMIPEGNMMLDYTYLGVIVNKLPFNEFTPGSFVKAYRVNFVLKVFLLKQKENVKELSCISLEFVTNISI